MKWCKAFESIATGLIAAGVLLVWVANAYAQDVESDARFGSAQSLWISNSTRFGVPFISEIPASKLGSSGVPKAALSFTFPARGRPGIAFDAQQDLWMVFCDASVLRSEGPLIELTRNDLQKLVQHQRVRPSVIIDYPATSFFSPPLDCPDDLKFDSAGNLWVVNSGIDQQRRGVVEFTPGQLAHSGSPLPVREINSTAFEIPLQMDFDSAGNLWIADSVANAVFGFSAAHVARGGTMPPDVTLQSTTAFDPGGIAIDHNDNLWVGYEASNAAANGESLQLFAASDLAAGGSISPLPMVTINPAKIGKYPAFGSGDGLEFDSRGNLWVSTEVQHAAPTGRIVRFAAAQIAASGSPVPKPVLNSNRRNNFLAPGRMVFGPTIP